VQSAEEDLDSLATLLDVPITSPQQDVSIPLRNVVTINRSTVPTEVVHQDLRTGIDLVMAVDGRDLGHVAEDVVSALEQCGERQADGTIVPYAAIAGQPQADANPMHASATGPTLAGVRVQLSGEYVRMKSMFRNLGGGLALATLLVYLLLVTLFQSFRLPLVILFAIPLGLIGVVWTLYLTDTAVNVQSLLGVIFMVGVVVANTVLLVDYTQKLRRNEGLSPIDAIRQAACLRMRPILMTALAALLALLPMALAFGRGSEANAPLGRAVIGGLVAGLLTTLLVVPCLYAWMFRADVRPETASAA
jgi:multidrug efflux pump subunit AcrB